MTPRKFYPSTRCTLPTLVGILLSRKARRVGCEHQKEIAPSACRIVLMARR